MTKAIKYTDREEKAGRICFTNVSACIITPWGLVAADEGASGTVLRYVSGRILYRRYYQRKLSQRGLVRKACDFAMWHHEDGLEGYPQ